MSAQPEATPAPVTQTQATQAPATQTQATQAAITWTGQRTPSTPEATRTLLAAAARAYATDPSAAETVRRLQRRLDEPLRVAIAGRLKAGKSTLLNALLGEEVAATDAGECTLVSTWYVHGATPSARLFLTDGRTQPLVLRRVEGRLSFDLAGHRPDEVARIEVAWPAPVLAQMTLIDTPGLGSLTVEASQRTLDLVTPTGAAAPSTGPGVDALIYLMRHRQADDLAVLEEFRRQSNPSSAAEDRPMNVIGVLSRADEVGGGGLDALIKAKDMATTYARDPRVRPVCQGVLPLAGLVAQGAQTLRQTEFESLRQLAAMPKERRELLMLSAQRFVTAPDPDVAPDARRALVDRLGLFGIRLAMVLLPYGHDQPMSLADELLRRSGLPALQQAVVDTYARAAELLKASTALTGLRRLLAAGPCPEPELPRRFEATVLAAHDLRELRLVTWLSAGGPPGLSPEEVAEALRLAGAYGDAPATRLGLTGAAEDDPSAPAGRAGDRGTAPSAAAPTAQRRSDPTAEDVRRAALEALARWRRVAADPLAVRAVRECAETLTRTCEALLLDVDMVAAMPAGPTAPGRPAVPDGAPAPGTRPDTPTTSTPANDDAASAPSGGSS
ncbi:dynamin family protein [Raineyella sp. LH-20]|uniref:dynamin family protein n=1 Tax=Raineyella sp. LH-20 TaxID=3081204 RepID=UPI002953A2B3|nr:dynamin family protein [Raineyella sp. LH-20]WOP20079.1 GTPase [Raineyella sp. LH-20]